MKGCLVIVAVCVIIGFLSYHAINASMVREPVAAVGGIVTEYKDVPNGSMIMAILGFAIFLSMLIALVGRRR